jgi:hypothetical protein
VSATGGVIPDGFERSPCRWCSASIFWARILDPITLTTKRHPDGKPKLVPLDRVPCAEGTWKYESIVHRGVRWISSGELGVPSDERWRGHHVSCPSAPERKPKPKPKPAASVTPIRRELTASGELVLFPKGGGGS